MTEKTTKAKKEVTPIRMSSIDFLVATFENRAGLERVLHSILDKYPGAKITVADASKSLDRAYYKELRSQLGEAGMLNRLKVHSVAYNAPIPHIFNELNVLGTSTYKLFLTDQDVITKDTDVEKMVRILRSNKTIGVVGGSINGKSPKTDGDKVGRTEEGDTFSETKQIDRFMMMMGDVRHFHRFDPHSKDFVADFCAKAKRQLPFKIVTTDVDIVSDTNYEESETSNSDGGGDATERPLSSESGSEESGGDSDSSSVGEDEESKDPTPSRRSSGGSTRSVQGKGDK